METTPFGHGRPYSKKQIGDLLRDTQFAPVDWSEALMFPPIGRGMILRSALWLERVGSWGWAPFCGVHIVEAVKQVYTPVRAKRKAARVRRVEVKEPVLVPGGVLVKDGAGALVGAVGVSGDTSDNDEIAALAGIEAVGLKGDTGA